MAGFAKMTKVTKQFYLVALLVVLLLTVADSLYVCMDDNTAFNGKVFFYDMGSISQEQFIEKIGSNLSRGKDIANIYCDKVNDFEMFGYYPMLLVLIIILLVKQCAFFNVRSAEFKQTFPVKQSVQILHDYLSVLGILVLSALLQLGIFLVYQTSFNMEMLKTAKSFSVASASEQIIGSANEKLMLYWAVYLLYIIAAYTWIYMGMILAKNPIVGVILSVIVKYNMLFLVDAYKWTYFSDVLNDHMEFSYWLDYISSPHDAFGFGGWGLMTGVPQVILPTACSLLAVSVLLVLLMPLVGKKRELSKGKLLYFPILDYPLSFILAILFFEIAGNSFISLDLALVLAVIIFILIHPWPTGKRKVLEVK